MNITETWPQQAEPFPLEAATISDFIIRRIDTYRGFASIEQGKGLLSPTVRLQTSHGQEMLRVLMFRVIEEVAESIDATDPNHVKEEAIDAINYLWSMLIIDDSRSNPSTVVTDLLNTFITPSSVCQMTFNVEVEDHFVPTYPHSNHGYARRLNPTDLGQISIWLAGDVGNVLRNRAWMQNAQDVYFAGYKTLLLSIYRVTALLMMPFESFDEFARFYIAKDEVLKFRLRSRY